MAAARFERGSEAKGGPFSGLCWPLCGEKLWQRDSPERCEIQVSTRSGCWPDPSISGEHLWHLTISEQNHCTGARTADLRPRGIIEMLDRRPIYRKTAAYSHFGREEPEFTWERTDRAADLRKATASNSS